MDSDSDNSNTAAQRKRVAIDTLDSDSSDDDLLEQMKPTFGRKRRSKETYKTKADRILNQAMKSSQKDMEQQRLISKIKKEEIDEEDLIANAARLREEESKFPKSRQETRALVEGTLSIEGGGAEHDSWERQLALAEAADTQNTCSLGSRATISTAKEHPIPATRYQALEYLQHILDETTANQLSPSIRNVLTNNLRKQTIHSFLLNKQLGTLDHSTTLPKPLLHWFFLIACSSSVDNNQAGGTEDDSLESLACGCYLTLTKMWTEFKGFPEKGFLLRLADLPDQLEAWFGLSGKRADLQPPQKETTLPSTRSEIAICRFLRLWDVAFSQKMVYIADADDDDDNSAKDVLPQATKCISGLLLTGMNKCFESKKTRSNEALSSLCKLIGQVLQIASRQCGADLAKYQKWRKSLADTIFEALSQLGPGALGAEDADDKEAWFCQSRAIRMIMASSVQVDDNNFSCCELSICLAAKVIKAALHVSDWNADVLSTLKKWDLSQELLDSRRWQALASSSLTLSKLSSNFPKNTNEEGPKSMAIVEISHLCLQAAMVMFGTHFEQQGLLKANDDDELDEPNAKELECIYLAFEQLEQQLLDLASKSNTHIMGNAHFLRLNYYVHGMRQYPRLEKLSFKSKPTVAMQSSLDDFFTKSK